MLWVGCGPGVVPALVSLEVEEGWLDLDLVFEPGSFFLSQTVGVCF